MYINISLLNAEGAYFSIFLCAVAEICVFCHPNLIQNVYSYRNASQRLTVIFLEILSYGKRIDLHTNDTWNQYQMSTT